MVLYTQIKGNNLIEKNTNYYSKTKTTNQNHPKNHKKKTERKQADDEPFKRQEVYILGISEQKTTSENSTQHLTNAHIPYG